MLGKAMKDYEKALADAMRDLTRRREEYVQAWMAETGCLPSECQLVEGDAWMTGRCERRTR
jgi:hypothetical protein